MARSRNIKPGFFTNDALAELPPLTRLLFIGLWTLVDRDGRIEDRPKKIKAECMPYDDMDPDQALGALAGAGFVVRYQADGVRCIQVQNWCRHQNPHIKEGPSTLPAPDKHHTSTVQAPDETQPLPALARLIPDSGFLIPDSLPLIPDAKEKTKATRKRATPCPDGVTEGTWEDWLTLRKAKRAPVTDTVVREAGKEAAKAGLSLDAFFRVWCARGSQGLQADWLKPNERGKPEVLSKWIKGTSLDPDFQGYSDDDGGLNGYVPALR